MGAQNLQFTLNWNSKGGCANTHPCALGSIAPVITNKTEQLFSPTLPVQARLYYLTMVSKGKSILVMDRQVTLYPSSANARTSLHLDGGLKQIFPNFMQVDLAEYGANIICRYSKDMNFHKIWRFYLKNWACYAHFNFEIQEGVADSIFQPHPPNFGQW